ncbi:hypothetical protein D3C73_1284910 [compost metagenome]
MLQNINSPVLHLKRSGQLVHKGTAQFGKICCFLQRDRHSRQLFCTPLIPLYFIEQTVRRFAQVIDLIHGSNFDPFGHIAAASDTVNRLDDMLQRLHDTSGKQIGD